MSTRRLTPIHPGEVLMEDFLKPFELTQYRLAKSLSMPARRGSRDARPSTIRAPP